MTSHDRVRLRRRRDSEHDREPEGLEVHVFGWTGQENIMPTCREAGN